MCLRKKFVLQVLNQERHPAVDITEMKVRLLKEADMHTSTTVETHIGTATETFAIGTVESRAGRATTLQYRVEAIRDLLHFLMVVLKADLDPLHNLQADPGLLRDH